MEKPTHTTEHAEEQHTEIISDEWHVDEIQHIHAKTIILLLVSGLQLALYYTLLDRGLTASQAIVSVYATQVVFITGCGLLANQITATIGGSHESIWLISTISIAACTLAPPISQAADLWGRKWLVVSFTAVGIVGSIICGRATSFGMLIGGQVVTALSTGSQPLIHAIAAEILPRKNRPIAQAATTIASAVGGIVGTLMGGALIRTNPTGWRTYFYINAGLFLVETSLVAWLYNPPLRELQRKMTTKEKLGTLDWIGCLLFIPGLILFSFALTSSSGVYAWESSQIIGPLVVGVVLLMIFFVYEWKFTSVGILHHKLFSKSRNFALVVGIYFLEGIVFYASNSYYGFEDAILYDQDLFAAGLHFTIAWFILVPAAALTGIYASWTKTLRAPILLAFTFFTIFCSTMASLNLSGTTNILGYGAFFGAGIGMALPLLLSTAQLSTPPELISITTGLIMSTRSVGGTVGLSIFTAILSGVVNKELPSKVLEGTVPLGFAPENLVRLLDALLHHDNTALSKIPGITPSIIEAAGIGIKQAYMLGFRYIWITATNSMSLALVGSFFIIDPKSEFTSHIDAPVETGDQLRREGILNKVNLKGYRRSSV